MMTRPKVGIQVREKEILRAEKKGGGDKKRQSVPPLHFQWCIKSRVLETSWWSNGQDSVFSLTNKKNNGSQSFSSRHKQNPAGPSLSSKPAGAAVDSETQLDHLLHTKAVKFKTPMEKHGHDALGRPHMEKECGLRPESTQGHTKD